MYYSPHILKSMLNGMKLVLLYFVYLVSLSFFLPVFTLTAQTPSLPLKPQSEEYFFKEIKLRGDAPIRDVRALLQDKNGFIWMASAHGLIRYDGHDFKVYGYNPEDENSIVDTELHSIYLLGDTLLCVGATHGVSLIDIRTQKIINIQNDQHGNEVSFVNDFYLDDAGTVWLAALNGLYSFKSDLSGIINHKLNIPPLIKGNPSFAKRAYCITQHSVDKNLLMIGTEYGLISFDKKRNTIHKTYPNTQATFWRSFPPVYKIIKEGNYLWAKCWISGMPRFDMINEKWENFAYPNKQGTINVWAMSDFMLKDENEMWVCDWDRGLCVLDKKKQLLKFVDESTTCPIIKTPRMLMFMLSDSTLWLASKNALYRQNSKKKRFRALDIPYSGAWIGPYYHDEATNDYYVGLSWQSYGVACWNSVSHKWTLLQTETNKDQMLNTCDIVKDSEGVIWIAAGARGLWRVDKPNKTLRAFVPPDTTHAKLWNNTMFKIFEDSKHNLWLGTGVFGVVRLNAKRNKADYFQNNPADSNSIIAGNYFRAIEEDSFGRIWVGNRQGFCTFDPETQTFSQDIAQKLYQTGVRNGYTYSIVKDTTNRMWMTIEGQGIVRVWEYEKNKFRFKNYRTAEGLKDLFTLYMTKDHNGNLWIINNGLFYLNPYNESFMLTDMQNGLVEGLGDDDKIMIDKYGNVFCGNQVGINWLDEVKKYSHANVRNLIIENILVNGEPFNWNLDTETPTSLSATKNQKNLTFLYTAICFEEYDQIRYRYKLEGLERDWSPPTRVLQARYTNLKPGKYRFIVDVAYKGNWLGYNKSVSFDIEQVFWLRWWFIALLVILASAVVYAIYINRKRYLEKQMNLRLKIASDLHDDVGSTLSSISIMSDLLQSRSDNNPNAEEMIREIGTNAHNMLESIDDIIWSVIPANDEFRNLILRIREYAIPLFESKDIAFDIIAPDEMATLPIPMDKRRNIFLIAKEAVNNLVKYARCSYARIEFSFSHSTLKMVVSDNGKGFDTTKDYGRNGLHNMKIRAAQMGGKTTIRSVEGKGTTITLVVR